ncbi:PAS domain S-box protein [Ammoniphilus resinae]|uniref:histidine kinase n=1 Tax=Ammoniphilus resinae TaxID=861532 RepID=A0ABS4GUX2_9BACL|nr:PAS domain S-box protein [Ammoniphilus resinae]MBP1934069.1 two-component system sporulation sensor kinase A [Ammoniphilus resinae]
MLKDLCVNISILLSFLFVIHYFICKEPIDKNTTVKKRIFLGVSYGAASAVLMLFRFEFDLGVVDLRHLPMLLAALYGGWVSVVSSGVVLIIVRLFWSSQMTTFPEAIAIILLVIVVSLLISSIIHSKKNQWIAMNLSTMIMVPLILSHTSGRTEWTFWVGYDVAFLLGGVLVYHLAESLRNAQATTLKLHQSQKQLEETVQHWREATEQLESYITHNADPIILLDKETMIVKVNPAFERLFGWKAEEIFRKPVPVIPSDDQQFSSALHNLTTQGRPVIHYEADRVKKDGSICTVFASAATIYDRSNQLIGYSVVYRDITEKKLMEEKLRRSEAQYRLIAEHSSDLIAMLSVNGDTLYVSPSHLPILGLTPEEFLGKNVVPFIHHEDTPRVVQLWRESLAKKGSSTLEYRFLHKDGHYVWLESNYVPILTGSGEVEKFVVISRDVTERKETENLLRNSEKLSVVGELAAGIAHEIRNPLTTLKGFMQMMKTEEDHPYYIDVMYGELERMEGITNEFLCLAKPQISEIKEIQIWILLEQVSTLLYPQALLNKIELIVESEPNLPLITCVENQIKQVFINLVKNAIEAMDHDGEIRLTAQREDEQNLLITIQDQGIGISPDKIKKLGQPFYSLKEKGTGLGLTVCQKIIREHRGWIDFRSEVGKGTTVEVRLPYRRNDR